MIVLRDPTAVSSIAELEPYPDIRHLVQQRFTEICDGEPFDPDLMGYMIVVEPGDTVDALEEETSCRIMRNLFDDVRFGDPEFDPSFEALEDHGSCFEMVIILNDDGFGIAIFIPKTAGIDAELLALCEHYAVPAMS